MIQYISPTTVVYTAPPTAFNTTDEFESGDAIYIPPTPIQRDGEIIYVSAFAGQVLGG